MKLSFLIVFILSKNDNITHKLQYIKFGLIVEMLIHIAIIQNSKLFFY